ncbi:hypothetical protein [Gordonia sp. AC31]|uniref:DUF7341 domain-containing protein n=1 Tax=Gordonia sp. AC31 TaxID=2962571 RepID=UPI002880D74B|nr:hypothetical protein [Gordonia sp. AC31]MDT0223478.1 hypothetical protein [Gordonia sp. AC31]
MNDALHIARDGDLPTARKHLADAIHTLAGRTRTNIERDPNPELLAEIEERYNQDRARINDRHDLAIERADRAGAAGIATRSINLEREQQLDNLQRRHEERLVALTAQVDWNDSLYEQLAAMIAGAQGTQLGGTARSMPPLWVDAADLITTIDRDIAALEPEPGTTIERLHRIADRGWRPQDVDHIDNLTAQITRWAQSIQDLLDPPKRKALPNPCPHCNTAIVYRKDSAGEVVRQPALQIGPHGCECQNCYTNWGPGYFRHLAAVLGYPLPEGVLE